MKLKLTSLVSVIVLASVLFVSCGKKKVVEAKGSVVHVEVGPSPETIDPALNSAVDGANMILHAFEGLLKFDRDNNVVAGVAEKWEQSADGLTWTFHLRPNLKWSDGSALTVNDFV
ncbi:MAG: peptide ABC transporter substrate-binding protein, partial [Treponema sp.]|nr:peptide ABC transporter substrate-binding protein [Treponema sp.]